MSSFPDWSAAFRSDRRLGLAVAGLALVCLGVPLLWDPGTVHFSALKQVLLLVGALLLWFAAAPRVGEREPDRIDWLSVGLVAWLLATLIWTPDSGRGAVDLSLSALGLVLFLAGRRIARFDSLSVGLPWLVASSGLVLSVWALVEWAVSGQEPQAGVGNTNYMADLLAAQLPFVLLVVSRLHFRRVSFDDVRFLGILAHVSVLGIMISAILVTHSRAALSAAILAWCVWMVRPGGPLVGRRLIRVGIMAAVAAGFLVGLGMFGGAGLAGRLYLARISVGLVGDAVWFGHGLGAYATIFPEAQGRYLAVHPGDVGFWTNAWTAHCEPLQLWIEGGLVGFGATVLLGLWGVRKIRCGGREAVQTHRQETSFRLEEERRHRSEVFGASLAGLAALGVTMFSEGVFHHPAHVGLGAIFLGLLLGLGAGDGLKAESRVAAGSWAWQRVLWVVLGLALLGSGVCTVRQYWAERSWGQSLSSEQPTRQLAAIEKAELWACDAGPMLLRQSLLLERVGRRKEALRLMRRAVESRPGAIRYLAMGNLLARIGRIDEAVSAYEHSLHLHPRLAGAYYNLGIVLEGMGRSDRARRMLLRAHSLLPGRYPLPKEFAGSRARPVDVR